MRIPSRWWLLLVLLWIGPAVALAMAPGTLAAQRAEPMLSAFPHPAPLKPHARNREHPGVVERQGGWPRGLRGALIGATVGGLYGYFALRGECTGDQQCNRAKGVLLFAGTGALAGALIDAIASGGHSLARAAGYAPGRGAEAKTMSGEPPVRGPRRSD